MKCLFPIVGDICLVQKRFHGTFGILLFLVPETPRYLAMTHQDDKSVFCTEKVKWNRWLKTILSEIKAVTSGENRETKLTGWTVVVVGILLSVFQQAIGINVVSFIMHRVF